MTSISNISRAAIVAGDVGGTHVRLSLVFQRPDGNGYLVHDLKKYLAADYPGLGAILSEYLADLDSAWNIAAAAIAIAGVCSNGVVKGSRLAWDVSETEVHEAVGDIDVMLFNDFYAAAFGTQFLTPSDQIVLREGEKSAGTVVVMGPGTGFGAAAVTLDRDHINVVRTEGGKTLFVPCTQLERELTTLAATKVGRVRVETFLSGSGLQLIHTLLGEIDGEPRPERLPQEITQSAFAEDPAATRTIAVFLDMLASVARNLALAYYAEGGVYIGGGVIGHLIPLMDLDKFLSVFCDDDVMQGFLQTLPLAVLISESTPLLGAAAVYCQAQRADRQQRC